MKSIRNAALLLLLPGFVSISYAEVGIDLSSALCKPTSSSAIRITGITAEGYTGTYWADFTWNPLTLVFEPTVVGEVETAANYSISGEWASSSCKENSKKATTLFSITQSGGNFRGIWSSNGKSGMIYGTISGNSITITKATISADSICNKSATLTGSGSAKDNNLTYSLSGERCETTYVTKEFISKTT